MLTEARRRSLNDVPKGARTVIRRVPDGDPELLRYLASLGLSPAAEVVVVERAPFEGPVTIDVAGARHSVAPGLLERIEVAAEA